MRIVAKAFLRYMLRRRSLALLQLLGIACGVAAVVGMALSAQSALSSFNQAVEFLRGKATHLMEERAGPMDETVLRRLMTDVAIDAFSPVIDRRLFLGNGSSLRLLGIDPFLDGNIRPELARIRPDNAGGGRSKAFLSFITDNMAVLLDSGSAQRLNVAAGSDLPTSKGTLRVAATFPNPSGEPLAVMDIAHVQDLFGLPGRIDRVDLLVNDEASFRARWDKGFRIESSRQRRETLVALLTTFKLNLQALSLLALFVGIFLIYNTAMFAVASRRRDAGILRSLGAYRHEIVFAFLAEILCLGILGGALGACLGYVLSRFLTGLVGSTISSLYFFLKPSPLPWSAWNLLAGIVLGCGASLLGSISPLVDLIRSEPVQVLRGRTGPGGAKRGVGFLALMGLATVVISVILLSLSSAHVYVGFAGAFVFLLGVSLMAGAVIVLFSRPLQWIFARLAGLAGKIAAGNVSHHLNRTAVAVAAFMVALSMSVGLGSMIDSFRQSLVWWMKGQLKGDIYISTKGDMEVPEGFYREISAIKGIGGVDAYRNVQIMYRGAPVYLTAINAQVLQKYADFAWVRGGNENWDPVKNGAVIISESFARRFKTGRGKSITVESAGGPVTLPVSAVFYDYTTEHGLIMMDRTTYVRIFNDRTINSLGVFIDPGSPDRLRVLEEVRKRAGERRLPVISREELYGNILAVFDNTFAVTRSMRILAIIVAFFGIAGALMTLFVERQREFGIYRALGFSSNQIAGMTLSEGLVMGIISFLMSIGVGTGLAVILIKVINVRSFNWTVFYHFSPDPYLLAGMTAILASVGASLYPLWKVYSTYPQMQIREE